jgi:phosphopantothenoylcysteine decarboxylase/phosphopantothenate--cysteine ligase
VSDFRPGKPLAQKKKTSDRWTLELERTEDILAGLGAMKGDRMIVGFALETENVETNAMDKLKRKRCDLIVVNNPLTEGAAFAHDTNVVTIFNPSGQLYESDTPESKREIAHRILALAAAEKAFEKITAAPG